MKRGTRTPWMAPDVYGRSLAGLTVNLLVRDVAAAVGFARAVLDAEVVYDDADFAVLRHGAAEWMLHADHTYDRHPLHGSLGGEIARGVGAELRLHGRDPDAAVAAARAGDHVVLEAATDKPHGLREAFILDPDGYLWVPDVPLAGSGKTR